MEVDWELRVLLVFPGKERIWLHITHGRRQHTCQRACERIRLRRRARTCVTQGTHGPETADGTVGV